MTKPMVHALRRIAIQQQFSKAFGRFLLVNTSFGVLTQICAIFVNTFMLRASGSTDAVIRYNMIIACVQPIVMVPSVLMINRMSAVRSQQFGLFALAVCQIVLMVLGESAVHYSGLVAVLYAVGNGFYFTTYALQIVTFTIDGERDAAYGVMGVISGASSLIIPLLSGLLISSFPVYTGYRLLFVFGLAITCFAIVSAMKLPPIKQPVRGVGSGARFLSAAKCILNMKSARAVMTVTAINGVRAGTMMFFLNMLLYQMIHSEFLIGVNAFVGGGAAIIASALYTRFVRKDIRAKSMALSIVVLLLATLPLYLISDPVALIAYNFICCFMSVFIDTTPVVTYMAVLEKLPELADFRPEVHALREIFLSAGRVVGLILVLVLPHTIAGSVSVIAIQLASQFLCVLLVSSVERSLAQSRETVDIAA